jgi:chromate transporter
MVGRLSRPSPTFAEALRYWVRLGFINFGGPAGQIAIMHRDLVERRGWIDEDRFLHALNFCMLLPGPEATQLAIYIGWLLHGTRGGMVAGLFFILPSIFILLGLSYAYAAYGNIPAIAGILAGIKPVVVAIVVEAVIRIGRRALKGKIHIALAIAAFVAIYVFRVPFPLIVLGAGVIGLGLSRTEPTENPEITSVSSVGSVRERNTDSPLRVCLVSVVLWLAPYLALLGILGRESLHAHLYRFFTLAAFVTFGGAYAVLAYVSEAAANQFHWLSPTEAVDGLALAETTPGPLIMVLQFVGFMAGWNQPGAMGNPWSALLGALITTWTTFLPSFAFIFLGAPHIERIRGSRSLSASLSGITAAVVGVILNLAVVFGAAVLFPSGMRTWPDPFAVVITVAAFVALLRFKVDVLWVVLGGGAVGLLYTVLR